LTGYTNTVSRSDREALRELIASHEMLVAPVVERFGGRIVKNLGDSYMALFDSATDAVRACQVLVENITREGRFSIRAGVATGDVEVIDGDAFGDAVNLAARILAKCPDAEVWFAPGTFACMNQSEIAWEPVGRLALKGFAGETAVYRSVPESRSWLPEPVAEAVRSSRLVRIQRGDPLGVLPPQPIILLEGFIPGSQALHDFVDRLPVVDPAALWLVAYNIPPVDRHAWQAAGRGLVIGSPAAVDEAVHGTQRPSHSSGSDTIILDVGASAVMDLAMAGLALPSTPMSEVVASYSYDLLADGRWVNRSERALGRVTVTAEGVGFTAMAPGVLVEGRQAVPGRPMSLSPGDVIHAPCGQVSFREIHDPAYAGLLLSDGLARLGVSAGQQAEIGREPNYPGLALPDRRGQANIQWCVGARAARARESGFTLDRALAGRRQAVVSPAPGGAEVVALHARCPTFLVQDTRLERVSLNAPRPVASGGLIVAGTSVIAVREPGA
ncbi:MAG: adenylate/guanylate cyclase domain-containing protein, partial [Myxococcota bacterium]|nr:adenylate/guanylate cyclase domain-containing protein [Myxococcota bacterium]